MRLKSLSIKGFKSFADPVKIDFDEGITCIVGPNGSGKSNVSDALRWVFGEQSARTLRGYKMEDVIFAGTEKRRKQGLAEVTVVIDNSDRMLDIEYNEVEITRRLFRSGESEHRINGNKCRLMDVRDLIVDTGVGVDGYSIIGQGKVEELVSNRNDGRRSMIEEAIGIVAYREKKGETLRKIEKASQNLERVNDILIDIEGRIGPLKIESEKAEKYNELSGLRKDIDMNLMLYEIRKSEGRHLKAEEDEGNIEKELNEKRACIDELKSSQKSRYEEMNELKVSLSDTKNSILEITQKISDIQKRNEIDDKERINLISRKEAVIADIERVKTDINELKDKDDNLAESISALGGKLASAKEELLKLDEKINKNTDESGACGIEQRLTELKTSREELSKKISRNEIDSEKYAAKINFLTDKKQSLEEALDKNTAYLEEEEKRRQESQRKRKELASTLDGLKVLETELLAGKQTLIEESKEAEEALEKAVAKEQSIGARIEAIEELEKRAKKDSASEVLFNAGIKGLKGEFRDYIGVKEDYITPIAAALKPYETAIVCDDSADAIDGIKWLSQNKAGRAAFITSKPTSGRNSHSFQDEDGFECTAKSVVNVEKSGYDNLLRLFERVYIFSNVKSAVKASSKLKAGEVIVTMDGTTVSPAGAMTGGSRDEIEKGAIARKNQISRLKAGLVDAIKDKGKSLMNKEAIAIKLNDLEDEILNAKNNKDDADRALKALDMDSDYRAKEEKRRREESENAKGELAAIMSDIENTKGIIEDAKKNMDDAKQKLVMVDVELSQMNVSMEEIMKMRREMEALKEGKKNEIASLETEVKSLHRERATMAMAIGKRDEEIAIKNENLKTIEQRLSEVSCDKNDDGELAKLNDEKAELYEKSAKISELEDELSKKNNEVQAEIEKNYASIMDLEKSKERLLSSKQRSTALIQSIKNRMYLDYDVPFATVKEREVKDVNYKDDRARLDELNRKIKQLEPVNMMAIDEYKKEGERYEFLSSQRDDITASIDDLKKVLKDVDNRIRDKFSEGFKVVQENFKKLFYEMFDGGKAELILADADDVLESNIDIIAEPPGKRFKNIGLLSGGEKTLTALCLMFSILMLKPSPFCILDEVEAALDDVNIERFVRQIKTFDNILFTIITHQKATMEKADSLYGVTMPERGISKVLSIRLSEASEYLDKENDNG